METPSIFFVTIRYLFFSIWSWSTYYNFLSSQVFEKSLNCTFSSLDEVKMYIYLSLLYLSLMVVWLLIKYIDWCNTLVFFPSLRIVLSYSIFILYLGTIYLYLTSSGQLWYLHSCLVLVAIGEDATSFLYQQSRGFVVIENVFIIWNYLQEQVVYLLHFELEWWQIAASIAFSNNYCCLKFFLAPCNYAIVAVNPIFFGYICIELGWYCDCYFSTWIYFLQGLMD